MYKSLMYRFPHPRIPRFGAAAPLLRSWQSGTLPGETAPMSKPTPDSIGPSTTVNDVLIALPDASGLLNDLGFDTCCGGSLTLQEQCADTGTDLDSVLQQLGELALKPA